MERDTANIKVAFFLRGIEMTPLFSFYPHFPIWLTYLTLELLKICKIRTKTFIPYFKKILQY